MTRKRVVIIVLVVAAIAAGAAYAGGWFHRNTALQGSGTVEARDIRVGSKIAGRIDKVLVREGDKVKAGQVLVTFDDREMMATLQQSQAAAQKAERGYRKEEIAEARAAADAAKAEYQQRQNGYRREDIAAAQAELDRAKADETRARLDAQRYDSLAEKDLVSKQQRDTADATAKMALAQVENAQNKLDALQRGYRPEEIAAAKARYEQAAATAAMMERGNRPEDVASAKAAYSFEQARFRETQVVAPRDATVEVLDVRPGDLIAPNTPVATLLEQDQIYVRIYIPETELGRVQLGQKAEIRVDSFPNTVFDGVVEQINQKAEFLPRNVQTREERVHQVFGIKVRINDTSRHGITFFVTTHYMDEAERCSHVAYIYYGKLIADGTPNSLRELPEINPPGTMRIEISTPEVTRALRYARQFPNLRSATIFGQSIHALVDDHLDLHELREKLLKDGVAVAEIRPLAPSLEDVFVELTYKHQAELEATRA